MKLLIATLLSFLTITATAQRISSTSTAALRTVEDTLRELSYNIIHGKEQAVRERSNDEFIPKLVKALKTPYSYYYPFDSVRTMAKVYPADSTFRVITWPLEYDNSTFRHFGVIQMNTKDGSLKLFPLFDNSDFTKDLDTITNHKAWYGCLYYAMIQRRFFNNEYYTLFGWDANSQTSQKKVMEMLTFKDGEPVFGGPYFSFAEDTVRKPTRNRFIIEYKREAVATLNYNPEMDMVVYDHLISETGEDHKKYTYVPDLDFEGFKWKAGKWVHIEKVFHDALEQGKAPVVAPIDRKRVDLTRPRTAEEIMAEEAEKAAQKGKKKKKNR